MDLKVDSREPNDMIDAMRKEVENSDVIQDITIKELETADFVCSDIGVERKEVSDFASSVQDRRISEQGDRMVEEFEHRYVVLEDRHEGEGLYDLKHTSIASNSLIGQQVSLAAKRDIRIIKTDGIEGTAFAVRRIVERSLKDESVGHTKTVDVETGDVQVAILAQIEGISEEKAKKIIDETPFTGLGNIALYWEVYHSGGGNVSPQTMLEEVDGIGPKLAERIINKATP